MTYGLRRIAFGLGAVMLAGGWGLTKFIDANQRAAGSDAATWWSDVRETSPAELAPAAAAQAADGRVVPRGLVPAQQFSPPASGVHVYLFSVVAMALGAGIMALTVPWRGERMSVTAGAAWAAPTGAAHAGAAHAPTSGLPGLPAAAAGGSSAPGMASAPLQPGHKPIRFKGGA